MVGCFGPLILLSSANNYNVDFLTITKENLKRFTIPISFDIAQTAVVHGLAGWFDLHFLPPPWTKVTSQELIEEDDLEMKMASTLTSSDATIDLGLNFASDPLSATGQVDSTISPSYMTTSPYATPTHWQQVRFLFQETLAINKGQRIVGEMLCEVNDFRWVPCFPDLL